MTINFEKYSVLGNDFIMLDGRDADIPENPEEMIISLCRRRFSIGADGVIIVRDSEKDYTAEYYNSDGLQGNMCGNGARAVIDYGYRKGWSGKKPVFKVWNDKYKGIVDGDRIGVELTIFSERIEEHGFSLDGTEYKGFHCNSGVPHIVFFDRILFEESPIDFAREIRFNKVFDPDGTNVNFANIVNQSNIYIRTYERGVEDFTYACGTGSMAAVFTALNRGVIEFPVNVHSHGGSIEIEKGSCDTSMWLWSKVDRIYTGTTEYK